MIISINSMITYLIKVVYFYNLRFISVDLAVTRVRQWVLFDTALKG
jgi:hypothetical protein